MFEHPQVVAFRQASDMLRDERYWARNADEELECLRTFMPLLREVSYHLDAMQALDPAILQPTNLPQGRMYVLAMGEPSCCS